MHRQYISQNSNLYIDDASKLDPSLHARHDPRLTARKPGRPDGRAKIKIT
jgi:hypothetical protein